MSGRFLTRCTTGCGLRWRRGTSQKSWSGGGPSPRRMCRCWSARSRPGSRRGRGRKWLCAGKNRRCGRGCCGTAARRNAVRRSCRMRGRRFWRRSPGQNPRPLSRRRKRENLRVFWAQNRRFLTQKSPKKSRKNPFLTQKSPKSPKTCRKALQKSPRSHDRTPSPPPAWWGRPLAPTSFWSGGTMSWCSSTSTPPMSGCSTSG